MAGEGEMLPTPQEGDDARVEAARAAIDAAVREYVEAVRAEDYPNDPPYVVAWAVGVEWTNAAMERENKAGREIGVMAGQMLSASLGLGQFIADAYLP